MHAQIMLQILFINCEGGPRRAAQRRVEFLKHAGLEQAEGSHNSCPLQNGIAKSRIKLIRTYAMSMSDPLGDCTEVMVLPG